MAEQARLSGRERQIMDIVYARGEATATHVLADMADPPSRTAVRTFLRILEEKGHLKHRKEGREYVYRPIRPRTQAGDPLCAGCWTRSLRDRSKRRWPRTWPIQGVSSPRTILSGSMH